MTDKELYESLTYENKNAYLEMSEAEIIEMKTLCDDYRVFLNNGKTERECVKEAVKMAEAAGFSDITKKNELKPGDKIYKINRNKNIFMAVIGSEDITQGINIAGAHIDSPRLDLKQNPLYESTDMALLKTHYYGGIKKYQWPTIPLAIHGVIYNTDGEKLDIVIGEKDDDPVFVITDLLPHLAKDQMVKKMTEGIEAENMNVLIGGMPIKSEDVKEKVKFSILKILNARYKITEKSFQSAEFEIVPAYKARNVGLDESFIGAYGHDDRVCAYTTLRGILEESAPKRTACAILVDKEEIGSMGNTGAQSAFMMMTIAEIVEKLTGCCSVTKLNRVIENSAVMSSDVSAAVDPNYLSVSESKNASYAGQGVAIMKYTGARGKYDSSDANAEFVYEIGRLMDNEGVIWQTGELGKVDQGGGGTIAQYVANLNMDVIDCGVPVLSMHSPFEVVAKSDVYMAYRAYKAFFRR
ncbi:MAG: aminopeptidase [Oscillospiraceae bacterium]|nr:aminopeptidase [Oscillospiraceae bacterium]